MAQFFKEVARQRGNDALYEENYDKIFGKKEEVVVNQETSKEEVTPEVATEEEEKEKLLIILEIENLRYEWESLPEVKLDNLSSADLKLTEHSIRTLTDVLKKYNNSNK